MFKFLKKLFQVQKIEVGQVWVDKDWDDTLIKILAISNNKSRVRFKFVKNRGKDGSEAYMGEFSPSDIRYLYKLKYNF